MIQWKCRHQNEVKEECEDQRDKYLENYSISSSKKELSAEHIYIFKNDLIIHESFNQTEKRILVEPYRFMVFFNTCQMVSASL